MINTFLDLHPYKLYIVFKRDIRTKLLEIRYVEVYVNGLMVAKLRDGGRWYAEDG